MSNTANRDGRITNRNTRKHVRALLTDIVDCRGSYKEGAKAVGWNVNPVHAIVKRDDWTQKILYPEDVTHVELVHDLVMSYTNLSNEARVLTDQLIEQSHAFVSTARELRRLLRRM